MDSFRKWQLQCIAKEMTEVLKKRQFDAHYAEDLQEAREMVLGMIPKGSSIGLGGSITVNDTGLTDIFRNGDYKLNDRFKKVPQEEKLEIMRQSLLADFFVTGTNAVTRQGELVNMDNTGNRTAGMIFGPKRVIVIVGANKVVENVQDAMTRIRSIAPMNARRNNHKSPCAETGVCVNCQSKGRGCNVFTVIYNGIRFEGRISVIMVADEAGF